MQLSMVSLAMQMLMSFLFVSLIPSALAISTYTIHVNQSLQDGDALLSAQGTFELVFFSPGNSRKRYVGIQYGKIGAGAVVWVANRDSPLNDSSGVLRMSPEGNLIIYDSTNSMIWSSNSSKSFLNPVAQLLDSGNLVIRGGNDKNPRDFSWESFDYMGDTALHGTRFSLNLVTGLGNYLSSWKSEDDPSVGGYSLQIDPNGVPQLFVRSGSVDIYRAGRRPWEKISFVGRELFFSIFPNVSALFRLRLNSDGQLQVLNWAQRTQEWVVHLSTPKDRCDHYALCGPYGVCNANPFPDCGCLRGFERRNRDSRTKGCTRRVALDCGKGENFLKLTGLKLPDTRRSWYNETMDLRECGKACLQNCSCLAYAILIGNGDSGRGCIQWFNGLMDIRQPDYDTKDIYIRLSASEIAAHENSQKMRKILAIIAPCVGLVILGIILSLLILRRRKHFTKRDEDEEEMELPLFDFKVIAHATNNFSSQNELGKGGFGFVFKGTLIGGQDIAVKRLSKNSGQGSREFKNEVVLIAKLQHRNLVKLPGCCIEGKEIMLVYEYMPNNSLDSFIFDQTRSKLLDWHERMQIIGGIAKGMLYLHHDSRLRIIHRDLKASNVLLDKDMNPKISDFGMARMFRGEETGDRTHKVVGTYGYMSPEYMIDGRFSVKSDVFSFGVLVLEILSGRRNRGFSDLDHDQNLLGHAWVRWKEDRPQELIDNALGDSYACVEMLRCFQIGLLCVQKQAEDRPNMSSVVLMLNGESSLPKPKKPGFFIERSLDDTESSSNKPHSTNEMTITELEPR